MSERPKWRKRAITTAILAGVVTGLAVADSGCANRRPSANSIIEYQFLMNKEQCGNEGGNLKRLPRDIFIINKIYQGTQNTQTRMRETHEAASGLILCFNNVGEVLNTSGEPYVQVYGGVLGRAVSSGILFESNKPPQVAATYIFTKEDKAPVKQNVRSGIEKQTYALAA